MRCKSQAIFFRAWNINDRQVCKFPEKVKKRMGALTTDEWVAERIAKLKSPSIVSGGELEADQMEVDDPFDIGDEDGLDAYADDIEVSKRLLRSCFLSS